MALLFLVTASLILLCHTAETSSPARLTKTEVAQFKVLLKNKLLQTTGVNEFNNTYHPLIAGFIRLAFHACAGPRCGGCLNVDDNSNNGLNFSIQALVSVRDQAKKHKLLRKATISHADLWALAASVAFATGEGKKGTGFADVPKSAPRIPVRFGRLDCPTAPYTREKVSFPDRRWNTDDVLTYFGKRGFTVNETVALMGAHALGVVRDIGSPRVIAQWVDDPDAVTNSFYNDLLDPTSRWHQVPKTYTALSEPIYSWTQEDNTNIMLNSDIALARNFTLINAEGQVGCTFKTCPKADTIDIVTLYSHKAHVWKMDFVRAYEKLITRGYSYNSLYDAQ